MLFETTSHSKHSKRFRVEVTNIYTSQNELQIILYFNRKAYVQCVLARAMLNSYRCFRCYCNKSLFTPYLSSIKREKLMRTVITQHHKCSDTVLWDISNQRQTWRGCWQGTCCVGHLCSKMEPKSLNRIFQIYPKQSWQETVTKDLEITKVDSRKCPHFGQWNKGHQSLVIQ